MKNYTIIIVLFVCLMIIVPNGFAALKTTDSLTSPEELTVLIETSGELVTMSMPEYLAGCLYAQIPINYSIETLKAQAIAAHTYALRVMLDSTKSRRIELFGGGDLSDNPAYCQPFFTLEAAQSYYGEDFEKYRQVVEMAAEYGAKYVITYENEPIYAVYHSVSSGFTNRPENVWGRKLPYLQPVASKSDSQYLNFYAENEMTTDEARSRLLKFDRTLTMPIDYNDWFADFNADENGYVISASLGGRTFSGGDIWRIFGLRSTAFTVRYSGDVFVFTTKGYGHGAGLSQFGAEQQAAAGKTCEDILKYYYTDIAISSIKIS